MSGLATIYYPNLNPVGVPSIAATCVVLVLTCLTMPAWIPARLRRLVTACAPALLLFLAWPIIFTRFHDADDEIAIVIWLVFGFAFAMDCFAFLRLGYRLIGWVFTLAHGCVCVVALTSWVVVLCFTSPWVEYHIAVLGGGLIGFLILWIPVLVFLERRARRRLRQERGCCPVCNYSLTGNISGICPECGQPIDGSCTREGPDQWSDSTTEVTKGTKQR
jgi:hypothetical protein